MNTLRELMQHPDATIVVQMISGGILGLVIVAALNSAERIRRAKAKAERD